MMLLRVAGVVAVMAAVAWGQAPADAALSELERLERLGADSRATTEERGAAVDAAIGLRRRLIDAGGDDPRLITWRIDQAAAMLARLGRDAADTAVLFGLPSEEERGRVAGVAAEASALLDAAHEWAASVTDEQTRLSLREAAGPGESSPLLTALRDEQVRGQLVRGRAALLTAALAGAEAGRHAAAQASIDALSGIGFEEAAGEGARRASLGAALVLRGETGDAPAAMQQFAWVLGADGNGRSGVLPATFAEALLGRLRACEDGAVEGVVRDLTRTRGLPPRTVRGQPDPLWHLLFADAVGRAMIERWRSGGEARRLSQAFGVYDAFESGEQPIGLEPAEVRASVLARREALSRWGGEIPVKDLPPSAALARAVVLARSAESRPRSEEILAGLGDREDAGAVRADALWELGVLIGAGEDRRRAVEIALRFAREYAGDARADSAIEYAVHHARALAEAPLLADALRLATSSFTHLSMIDRWRVDRARLLLGPGADADRATALALLEAVASSSEAAEEAEALYDEAQSAYLDGVVARMSGAVTRSDADEARRLAAQAAAEARRATAWARARDRPSVTRYRVDLADALVESGDAAGAAAIYAEVLDRSSAVPGGSNRVRLGLGRARVATGDDAGAFAVLRDLVTPLDGQPPSTQRPPEYWHAWALMLEILSRAGSERAGTIRVHAERLSTIDASWGGEPWRGRIRRVLDGLGGERK